MVYWLNARMLLDIQRHRLIATQVVIEQLKCIDPVQIQHMKKFIEQEAREKAEEIQIKVC